ncbi:MAG: hypothetical protein HKO57_14615, partial [Akkermansiaceae bacterium]|nr:hypothetical protein [Akkermansiaceae bacterium]
MLQPKGAALLGASLALIAVGLVRIDGILITLGGAALLLFVAAFLFGRRNLRRLAVTMRAPARLYADAPFDLRLTLYNHRRFLDAFHVDLTVHFPGGPSVHSHAPWTAARSSSTVHHRASLPQRGAFPTHHFTLASTTPLGLFHFAASGRIAHEILVFPRPLTPRELFSQGGLHDASML